MVDAKLDIVLLGATGFTGKFVAKKLAELNKNPEYSDLKWGLAGRSKQKLGNLLSELEELDVNISTVPVFECDINDGNSLLRTVGKAKVLMNSTGPNIRLSEPVVKACLSTRTHYVDISAELLHMVNIYRAYHKQAEAANVVIVPACGFASLPSLVGLMYLEKRFQGILQSVECLTKIELPKRAFIPWCGNCILHYGTWECFVNELQYLTQYRELKRKTFPEIESVAIESRRSFLHRHAGRFYLPYPGPDQDVVQMTQSYFRQKKGSAPYIFQNYAALPFLLCIFLVPAFFVAYVMSYFSWFNKLLVKYPRLFSFGYFSHEGPTEKMMDDVKYHFTLIGRGCTGEKDKKAPASKTATVKFSGSDPAYKTTATAFLFAAITILKESDKIPNGGVLTSGAAFRETTIVNQLHKQGILFEIDQNGGD